MAVYVSFEEPVIVRDIKRGKQQDGTPFVLVKVYEKDNAGNNSNSCIKCWGSELDEAITDGCRVVLKACTKFGEEHEKIGDKYGKPIFRNTPVVRGAVFELYKGE